MCGDENQTGAKKHTQVQCHMCRKGETVRVSAHTCMCVFRECLQKDPQETGKSGCFWQEGFKFSQMPFVFCGSFCFCF